MYRFIAFVWNSHDSVASDRALDFANTLRHLKGQWTELFGAKGMSVFAATPLPTGTQAYLIPTNGGIILGKVFPKNPASWSPTWAPHFNENITANWLYEISEEFLQEYWGGYIALMRNPGGTHYKVVRDCSGRIPCYRVERDSVSVFFSDISDLRSIGFSSFSIDWQYLATFLHSCDNQIPTTALLGVTELLAGQALECRGNSRRQYSAWDPNKIVMRDSIENYENAKESLRSTTQFCIDAWASVFKSITHRLSGGLDSAIVLGSLTRAPARPLVTCTHQFSDNPRDDERRYARLAATAANVPILELPRMPECGQFNEELASGQTFPRPNIQALFGTFDTEVNAKIATDLKSESTWTGQGGDHLFLQCRSSLGAADHVSRNGLTLGLAGAIRDAARLSREPYFFVLRSAWKLGRSRGPLKAEIILKRLNHTVHFVNADAVPDDLESYTAHPWVTGATEVPKGKQLQIFILTELLNRHRPMPNVEPVAEHHPLISQPLIELCLKIPTYQLLRGGRHRALARDAFSDRVPTEILRREDKGDTTSVVTDTIRRSEPFLRDLLLNGLLTENHIINRKALEPYIVHGQTFRMEHVWPLLSCVAAELWARAWFNSPATITA